MEYPLYDLHMLSGFYWERLPYFVVDYLVLAPKQAPLLFSSYFPGTPAWALQPIWGNKKWMQPLKDHEQNLTIGDLSQDFFRITGWIIQEASHDDVAPSPLPALRWSLSLLILRLDPDAAALELAAHDTQTANQDSLPDKKIPCSPYVVQALAQNLASPGVDPSKVMHLFGSAHRSLHLPSSPWTSVPNTNTIWKQYIPLCVWSAFSESYLCRNVLTGTWSLRDLPHIDRAVILRDATRSRLTDWKRSQAKVSSLLPKQTTSNLAEHLEFKECLLPRPLTCAAGKNCRSSDQACWSCK